MTSLAMNLNNCTTCSGAPGNLALRFSSWVAIPTGQVFSWHCLTILHPRANKGNVPNPNRSAPNIVPIITSFADLRPPSTSIKTLCRMLFFTRAW